MVDGDGYTNSIDDLTLRRQHGEYIHNGLPRANCGCDPADLTPDIGHLCEALRWFVAWCFVGKEGRRLPVRSACVRFLAAAYGMFPDLVGRNMAEMGEAIGVSRKDLQNKLSEMKRTLNVRLRRRYNRRQ